VLFHAELLPPKHRRALIEDRIRRLKACIAEMTDSGKAACSRYKGAGHTFVHGYGLAIYTAELDYLESRRHFDLPGVNAA
jgi:hypothetical protein